MIRAKAKKDVAWKKESLEKQWGNNSVRYFHLALIFGQTKFLHVLSNCDTFTRFHCNRSDFPSSFHRAHKSTFLDFIQLFLFTVLISCFVCLMMCLHSKYIRSRMWFFVVFALFRLAHTHTWFNIEHINCECVVLVWCTRNTTPTTRNEGEKQWISKGKICCCCLVGMLFAGCSHITRRYQQNGKINSKMMPMQE